MANKALNNTIQTDQGYNNGSMENARTIDAASKGDLSYNNGQKFNTI